MIFGFKWWAVVEEMVVVFLYTRCHIRTPLLHDLSFETNFTEFGLLMFLGICVNGGVSPHGPYMHAEKS